MSSPIESLRNEFESALASATSVAALKAVRDDFLSRQQGRVTALLEGVGSGAAERPLCAREPDLAPSRPRAGAIDVTLPGRVPRVGRRHPLTIVRERVED